MKISFAEFLRLMNSLKSIEKLFSLKLVAKFGGLHARTLGGVESLGPPVGLTGFAQRMSSNATGIRKKKNKIVERCTGAEYFRKFATPNLPIVLITNPFFINFTLLFCKQFQ